MCRMKADFEVNQEKKIQQNTKKKSLHLLKKISCILFVNQTGRKTNIIPLRCVLFTAKKNVHIEKEKFILPNFYTAPKVKCFRCVPYDVQIETNISLNILCGSKPLS